MLTLILLLFFFFVYFQGDVAAIEKRIQLIEDEMEQSTSDYEKV